ncbi:MAG: heavy-metal-associated domain-containing protein [Planctomycetota bacterium]|nr:heavy-metal-associated domain-containing protein [Planctomycetota bacterium]
MACPKAVVTAFKKCDGVTETAVDFAKSTATVTYDPKKTTEETLLTNGLKGTKYTAAKPEEKKGG